MGVFLRGVFKAISLLRPQGVRLSKRRLKKKTGFQQAVGPKEPKKTNKKQTKEDKHHKLWTYLI